VKVGAGGAKENAGSAPFDKKEEDARRGSTGHLDRTIGEGKESEARLVGMGME